MWTMSKMRNRKGFAMVFVVLVALAMIIPAMILASNAVSRRKIVSGEMVSDKVLSVSDATVDKILGEINSFAKNLDNIPDVKSGIEGINKYYNDYYYAYGNVPDPEYEPNRVAVKFVTEYLLSTINGGKPYIPDGVSDPAVGVGADYDSYKNAYFSEGDGSLWDIEDNVGSYLYDSKTQEYYAVVRPYGSKYYITYKNAGYDYVKNLSTGVVKSLSSWDPNYKTNNRWIESDVNVEYVDDGENKKQSSRFEIRVTSYPISNSQDITHLQRSIFAEASLNKLTVISPSSGSGGSPGGNTIPAAFKHAIWSGGNTIVNGNISLEAANIKSNGDYSLLDTGGDLYATGDITLNGLVNVNGSVITAKSKDDGAFGDPIVMNGAVTVKQGLVYGQKEDLPKFSTDTENNVKHQAITHSTSYARGYYSGITTTWDETLNVNGLSVSRYVNGDAMINAETTINFVTPNSDPNVAWYVNGDLTFNGNTDIYVDKPSYIWVNGDIIFNGIVNIHGPVTFVSDKSITFNGVGTIKYDNDQDMVAIISNGEGINGGIVINGYGQYDGIFYAPNSDIILNGNLTIFGTVVGGGYDIGGVWKQGVILNGLSDIVFDTRLAGYNSGGSTPPPLPSSSGTPTIKGVKYGLKAAYRFMWREIISDPVKPSTIKNICKNPDKGVKYKYTPPQ